MDVAPWTLTQDYMKPLLADTENCQEPYQLAAECLHVNPGHVCEGDDSLFPPHCGHKGSPRAEANPDSYVLCFRKRLPE